MTTGLIGLTKVVEPDELVDGQAGPKYQAAYVKDFFSDPRFTQEQKDEVVKRHQARNALLNFTTYTKPNYEVNWHHEIMCTELDDFLRSPTRKRLMIFVGPRRGKSEIISRRLVAYAFGKNPDLNVISASYGADLAKAMSRDVQKIIDSDSYRRVFPDTQLNSANVKNQSKGKFIRTSDKFEIVGHTGSYKAAGVGGAITGAGADLGIIDDPIKDFKESMSPVKKQAIYDWYTSTFYTRLSKDGKIIILMTRWSDDDLCGRLLKEAAANPDSDQWEVISFPEMFDEENEYQHPLDPREEGEVLWPSRYSEKNVRATKNTVGTKVWTSLFQQQPKPGDGTVFKTSWFKYFQEPPSFDRVVVSWDFNFGNDTTTSDFVVGTVWGIKGANKYLIYMTRDKLGFTEALAEVVRVHHLFPKASYTVIEGKANGPAITDVVKDKIPGVVVYMPTTSKIGRALATSPQFEAGNIYLPDIYYKPNRERYVWAIKQLKVVIEEFKAFPFVDNDDIVDSTVQMILREFDTPAWLQNNESTPDAKAEPMSERDRIIAEIFGWGDKMGSTYNPEEMGPIFKLGF